MNAACIRPTVSIALLATTLMACTSSTDVPSDDAEGAIGQVSQAAKCTTCGGDPDPEPEGPTGPPEQGPSVQCTGPNRRVIGELCFNTVPGCVQFWCPGFTVVGRYNCPSAYPVQHCSPLTGACTCWTY
jgi:hypothetical protein